MDEWNGRGEGRKGGEEEKEERRSSRRMKRKREAKEKRKRKRKRRREEGRKPAIRGQNGKGQQKQDRNSGCLFILFYFILFEQKILSSGA
ncbi:hypothetical protein BDQ94DRAFT_97535 [Aspergillus welwitschiae]|uniref:Uncharacterized protein n=1 Tax=Aspergillus welwitschiae TaxID=1341132 RepID=A0A3F3PNV6_9EURO|nr:hypothetical protein BDQ94DRAFT_97535 [Aspergillus welwitschiae]RDH28442.1 hypothetical protein BDQ94DRAFT_97535 [Aspergillus welwitschiae]